ncbi:MAG: hypothetical protein PHN42_01840 [Bacilli bacterium]|nr:hypothetical protein [Bacilli bacterium]
MGEYKLSMIFLDVCANIYDTNSKICFRKLSIEDYEILEETLQNYVNSFLGYKIDNDYNQYYREIRKSFENILINNKCKNFENIIPFINEYKNSFFEKIEKYYYSSIFIDTMKKNYSNDKLGASIGNESDSYTISRLPRKNEEDMPVTIIKNINSFEKILQNFVKSVIESDSYFNAFFNYMDKEDAISYLFEWVIKNATSLDLEDVEKYFSKYTNYIEDNSLDKFKKPVKFGDLLGDEIYIMRKRANVNYETPYYLSFIVKGENDFVELPNIRLGIENDCGIKTAHILATQTSQDNKFPDKYREIENFVKKMLSKSKFFREYNPAHILSIILSMGLLKGLGIDKIIVEDYFPLRLQRLILENEKNDDELYELQYRLTNKNINNFLRICEFLNGITISEYPDSGNGLNLNIGDNVTSENPFLQKLYNMGYNLGIKNKIDEIEYEKSINK